ncbi:MAG TPA: thioesterase family protein [Thermosynechococcaceae cyanobacterium]
MPFIYDRTVHFRDTDAAGVVYFANVLAFCHEGYEAAIATTGIELPEFFRGTRVAVPIVHASVDFFRPMQCGDRLQIHLTPKLLSRSEFEISYAIYFAEATHKAIGKAITRHVCIHPETRSRKELPKPLAHWLHQWSGTIEQTKIEQTKGE